MERDISFDFLFTILKKAWWKIAIITMVVMLLVASFTHFFVPKKYASSIEFYIVNINASTDYTDTSKLGAASQLANDYMDIISSEYMLMQVIERLEEIGYENVTIPALKSMLQYSIQNESSVFTLTVVHTNPQVAYDVACTIEEIAPDAVTDMAKPASLTHEGLGKNIYKFLQAYNQSVKNTPEKQVTMSETEVIDAVKNSAYGITSRLNCIAVLTSPKLATAHYSPNLVTTTFLGGVIAALAAYVLFLLRSLFEQNITSEDDLKKMVGRPLIGTIPHWESTSKK